MEEDWEKFWLDNKEPFVQRCFEERNILKEKLENPMQSQMELLFSILELNSDTEFGKEHLFSNIKSIDDFKKTIPIMDYDMYSDLIEKEIWSKESILNSSKILRYLKTSGSTGKPKHIPFTEYWMQTTRTPALYALWGNYLEYENDMLNNPFSTMDLSTVREKTEDFLNGTPYQSISNRNVIFNERDWKPAWYEAPWFNESVPTDYYEKMYYRLRFFINEDLRAIVTINPSTLIALYNHLKNKKDYIVKEVYDGTINGKKIFNGNSELANKLEKIFKNEKFNMNDIWPNLTMISSWTSSSTQLYLPKLNELYPRAKILPYMACGSEGIVAIPIDDNINAAPLAINHGFYEFIPASIDINDIFENRTNTLLFNELKEGESYHLIMTQANGLIRYVTGDVYKVSGFYGEVPIIEFITRANTFFSFTGEKLTENQVLDTIQNTCKKMDIKNNLFIFSPVWDNVPYYELLIEAPEGCSAYTREFSMEFDKYLREVNSEFDSKRESNRLKETKATFIKQGTIDEYIELQKRKGNGVQFKYKPFIKDNKILEEIKKVSLIK